MANIVLDKSFEFAIRIVNIYKYLCQTKNEYVLSKQLLRSGTSVGANLCEAIQGQSKKDFLCKANISLKEASETEYWIKLLIITNFLTKEEGNSILNDCVEIKKMLYCIVRTSKNTIEN